MLVHSVIALDDKFAVPLAIHRVGLIAILISHNTSCL